MKRNTWHYRIRRRSYQWTDDMSILEWKVTRAGYIIDVLIAIITLPCWIFYKNDRSYLTFKD